MAVVTKALKAAKVQAETTDPLASYPPEYLTCRADRHQWARKPAWTMVVGGMAERETICADCGTTKVQIVNTRSWSQIGPVRYRYAPGYTMRKSGLVLADFRERNFRRDFENAGRERRIEGTS